MLTRSLLVLGSCGLLTGALLAHQPAVPPGGAPFRNAALPIIAMVGLDIGLFMSGAVVVESVYGWPGIGQLAWQAIQRIDTPIIIGVTLVSAVGIVLGNLLADLAAPFIDPRIKLRA